MAHQRQRRHLMDTLLGPMVLAGSAGFDGRWRTYVGVGRIFRR